MKQAVFQANTARDHCAFTSSALAMQPGEFAPKGNWSVTSRFGREISQKLVVLYSAG